MPISQAPIPEREGKSLHPDINYAYYARTFDILFNKPPNYFNKLKSKCYIFTFKIDKIRIKT